MNIGSGLVSTLILAILMVQFAPELFESKIEVISSGDINSILKKNAKDCKQYFFKGAMGSWVRDSALKPMVKEAKDQNTHITLLIILLDPRDEFACSKYAEEKNSYNPTDDSWSNEDVVNQIIATVAKIYQTIGTYINITLDIGFVKNFGSYRFDFSEKGGVLTQANKKKKGIYIPAGSSLYDSFKDEITGSLRQAFRINVNFQSEPERLIMDIASSLDIQITPERVGRINTIISDYRSDYE